MAEVVYTSNIRIERVKGPLRRAYLPAQSEPVLFGVHGAVAKHYGISEAEPHPITLDYVVAAAAGWLLGTFVGALSARKVKFDITKITAEATGDIELEENVLIIRRIHVVYQLPDASEEQEIVERVHRVHTNSCPVYRSIHKAIEITTEYRIS